jgi:hypothetical protein
VFYPVQRRTGHSVSMRTYWLEVFTSTSLVSSGFCLNYKKTVHTSFSSKMELRLTSTWRFKITWTRICLNVGFTAQQTKIRHWQIVNQEFWI